jgi:hypothetical protein
VVVTLQGGTLQKRGMGGYPPRKENNVFYGMKAMLKSELALKAGVSVTTLMRWCKPFREELARMGMQPRNRVLPPHIVQFLAEKFCIDV